MIPSTFYYKKYVKPCINMALKFIAFMAHVAALLQGIGLQETVPPLPHIVSFPYFRSFLSNDIW